MQYELPEDKIQLFNDKFEKANELAKDVMLLKEKVSTKLGFWDKRKANKAIRYYETCLSLVPDHWQTNWLIAKVYQVLLDHQKALSHFEKAIAFEKTNPDLPREASISAMDLGNIPLALQYSLEALHRNPKDAGLYCNHAVNLMVSGNDEEAKIYIEKAIEMEPNDAINQNVFILLQDVASGKRKRPLYNELG